MIYMKKKQDLFNTSLLERFPDCINHYESTVTFPS